ncbi:hypothetical protein [Streptomyces griseiscabiei]|uniref:Secreted protein n=1 Tax=Streptomyces griseiscabiei TaxID=2993540 RepID=A0ABU4L6G9_9ACTN|nr:hypothetical protein [Streptomyces griseiscabiei]MBZ3906281.1 hypothetical protein [Streptomyces griseiscabiei]MDX2911278.1 hypothetical protein [Streptomyces griseiscabiei]
MARGSSTAPRRVGHGPAAALAVLFAVLTALFLPPSYGGAAEHRPSSSVASVVEGRVTAAFEITRADSGAQADDGHSAALLRSLRDVPGERPTPPHTAVVVAPRETVGPPRRGPTDAPALLVPPASAPPTGCHQGRAPPLPPGT